MDRVIFENAIATMKKYGVGSILSTKIYHFSMKMYSNRRKELNALKKVLQQENEND